MDEFESFDDNDEFFDAFDNQEDIDTYVMSKSEVQQTNNVEK